MKQKVYKKDLSNSKFSERNIIGSFKDISEVPFLKLIFFYNIYK